MWSSRAQRSCLSATRLDICKALSCNGKAPSLLKWFSSAPYLSQAKFEDGKSLALRGEDINVWERRAPIAPQHIKELQEKGITTLVQPSTRRAYTMQEYENANIPLLDTMLSRAITCANGELPSNSKYTADSRTRREKEKNQANRDAVNTISNRILVLGSGRVSSPLIEYHTRDASTSVTVASRIDDQVQELAKRYKNTTPVVLDIQRSHEDLEKLIQSHDLVVSLVPRQFHPQIAKLCIKHKKNMVTTDYALPAMMELHESAKEAGITILQEVGLDPGIDHLLAMQCIDSIKDEGGKIESFISYCGGLPAPEHSNNALRYKFSWYPKGALMTLLNGAKYLKNGKVVEVERGQLLENCRPLDIFPGFHLEGYPNRDSTHYADSYNIKEAHTMLRGSIRYHGFADVCKGLLKLGLFSNTPYPAESVGRITSWRDLMNKLMGTSTLSENDLAIIVHDRLNQNDFTLKGIKDLGLLSEETVQVQETPFDTLSHHLSKRLAYSPGERDLVLLRHQIGVQLGNNQRQQHDISLIAYGDPNGFSAMARTVSITAAIASEMILRGEILQKGNVIPLRKDIYSPMLKKLPAENISWTKTVTNL